MKAGDELRLPAIVQGPSCAMPEVDWAWKSLEAWAEYRARIYRLGHTLSVSGAEMSLSERLNVADVFMQLAHSARERCLLGTRAAAVPQWKRHLQAQFREFTEAQTRRLKEHRLRAARWFSLQNTTMAVQVLCDVLEEREPHPWRPLQPGGRDGGEGTAPTRQPNIWSTPLRREASKVLTESEMVEARQVVNPALRDLWFAARDGGYDA